MKCIFCEEEINSLFKRKFLMGYAHPNLCPKNRELIKELKEELRLEPRCAK